MSEAILTKRSDCLVAVCSSRTFAVSPHPFYSIQLTMEFGKEYSNVAPTFKHCLESILLILKVIVLAENNLHIFKLQSGSVYPSLFQNHGSSFRRSIIPSILFSKLGHPSSLKQHRTHAEQATRCKFYFTHGGH